MSVMICLEIFMRRQPHRNIVNVLHVCASTSFAFPGDFAMELSASLEGVVDDVNVEVCLQRMVFNESERG
jgi:hypothetical protein